MAELLRQGRRNPLLLHEGPTPGSVEDTTPIVGMAAHEVAAEAIVAAVNDGTPGGCESTFRLGARHATTVYQHHPRAAVFWAWFPDPAWARRVVDALNGVENSGV